MRNKGALALLLPKHVDVVSLKEDILDSSSSSTPCFSPGKHCPTFDFCTIGFLQYEAQPLKAMQVRERNKEV